MEAGRLMATHLEYGISDCIIYRADFPDGAIVLRIPGHLNKGNRIPACFQVLDVVERIDDWRFKGQMLVEIPASRPHTTIPLPAIEIFGPEMEAKL